MEGQYEILLHAGQSLWVTSSSPIITSRTSVQWTRLFVPIKIIDLLQAVPFPMKLIITNKHIL